MERAITVVDEKDLNLTRVERRRLQRGRELWKKVELTYPPSIRVLMALAIEEQARMKSKPELRKRNVNGSGKQDGH